MNTSRDTSDNNRDEFTATDKAQSPHYNPPGLTSLTYRLGTHSTFYQRLLERLRTPGISEKRPLGNLKTGDRNDPAIALLDAWAVVGDVLTFYQERIANEGYLRTATENRSILELSRTIGHKLNPGVAASTYLAFTVEDGTPEVTVPQGTKVQSIPSLPGERPQTFETTETIQARVEWNSLKPYISQEKVAPKIGKDTSQLRLQGTNTQLQPGDAILLINEKQSMINEKQSKNWYFLTLQTVEPRSQDGYTVIGLGKKLSDKKIRINKPQVFAFRQQASLFGYNAPKWNNLGSGTLSSQGTRVIGNRTVFQTELKVGDIITAANQSRKITKITSNTELDVALAFNPELIPQTVFFILERQGTGKISNQGTTVTGDGTAFTTELSVGNIITASNQSRRVASINSATTLTVDSGFSDNLDKQDFTYRTTEWTQFQIQGKQIGLDTIYPQVLPGSWIVLSQPSSPLKLYQADKVAVVFRSDFGLSGKVTQIEVTSGNNLDEFNLRQTTVFAQSEALELFKEPQTPLPFKGKKPEDTQTNLEKPKLELEKVIPHLESGRTLIISGKPINPTDETKREIAVVGSMQDNQGRTTITFSDYLQDDYHLSTIEIYANVALATHGETIENEVLGSGNGGQANQRFKLKKPPLTYLSPSESSLKVYVNDVLWKEVSSLHDQDSRSQCYTIQLDDQGQCTITFGDGIHGSRLPSEQENVVATYRSGIGQEGEVKAGALTLMQNRPLGIREVTNPVEATGAADPEKPDHLRENAPRTVRILDRIVSLRDFEDFTRSFPGIGKAQAVMLWTGERKLVHITIAGVDGEKVEPNSLLFTNLQKAIIAAAGSSLQTVEIQSYKDLPFNLEAKVFVDPRYQIKIVETKVRKALSETFTFQKREFAQGVAASEVIDIIQSVEGVAAVYLDNFYINDDKTRELNSFLTAKMARWEEEEEKAKSAQANIDSSNKNKEVKPAQLLRLNYEKGVTMKMIYL